MKVKGKSYRTLWMEGSDVMMIDQNKLPFRLEVFKAPTHADTCRAISAMTVRGAGALGVAAAFAMAQAFLEHGKGILPGSVIQAKKRIEATRPTARNLFYATDRVYQGAVLNSRPADAALAIAKEIAEEDMRSCKLIGKLGNKLIDSGMNILTHCNAGWLAFVDYGSALSPVYKAHRENKEVFVFVDETRPRGQGARLTAWELQNEGVPHAIIPDNAAAHYMSLGKVDMVIAGADRIARNGDTANKIGTLEKAIVANAFDIPFFIAAPSSTIDIDCDDGSAIPIEERDREEVLFQKGRNARGNISRIEICNPDSPVFNPAFDVTPARYITAIITEKRIIKADEQSILSLF